jgi:hypothetical protein
MLEVHMPSLDELKQRFQNKFASLNDDEKTNEVYLIAQTGTRFTWNEISQEIALGSKMVVPILQALYRAQTI